MTVSGPLLRSVRGAAGVHAGHGSCLRVPPSVGRSDASVSRRLADSCVISGGSLLDEGQGICFVSGSRDSCESREVVVDSFADHSLSRDQDRVADFLGFANSLEDRKVLLNSRRISVLKGAVCEVLESSFRPPCVVHSVGSWRSSPDEVPSVGPQTKLGFSGRLGLDSLGLPFLRGSSVVVRRGSFEEGVSLDVSFPDLMF